MDFYRVNCRICQDWKPAVSVRRLLPHSASKACAYQDLMVGKCCGKTIYGVVEIDAMDTPLRYCSVAEKKHEYWEERAAKEATRPLDRKGVLWVQGSSREWPYTFRRRVPVL